MKSNRVLKTEKREEVGVRGKGGEREIGFKLPSLALYNLSSRNPYHQGECYMRDLFNSLLLWPVPSPFPEFFG